MIFSVPNKNEKKLKDDNFFKSTHFHGVFRAIALPAPKKKFEAKEMIFFLFSFQEIIKKKSEKKKK